MNEAEKVHVVCIYLVRATAKFIKKEMSNDLFLMVEEISCAC